MGAPQYEQAGADIGGTGTTNTIPRWTGPSTLGDSIISQDNGTNRLLIAGGTAAAAANGTNITIQAQNGGTGNTNGGIIDLVVGLRSGSGTRGYARIDGGLGNDVDLYLGGSAGPTIPYGVGQRAYSGQSHTCVYANAGYGAARASLGMVSGGVYTPALSVDTSGNVGIGTTSPLARLHSAGGNTGYSFACSGTTRAFRVEHNTTETRIVGVDNTLSASFQPLAIGGSEVLFMFSGVTAWKVNTSGHLLAGADNTYDIGASGATRPRIVYVGTGVVGGYIRAGAASAGVASTTTIGNGTSTTATAGAQTLPANPLGFIIAHVGTTEVRIPYYAV